MPNPGNQEEAHKANAIRRLQDATAEINAALAEAWGLGLFCKVAVANTDSIEFTASWRSLAQPTHRGHHPYLPHPSAISWASRTATPTTMSSFPASQTSVTAGARSARFRWSGTTEVPPPA